MRALRPVVALSLVAAPLTALPAQEVLDSGSVIRLQPSPSSRTWTGRLHGMAGDTLWVSSLGAPVVRGRGRMVIAPPGVARIEISPDYDAISRRRHRVIAGGGGVVALFMIAANRSAREQNAPFVTSPLVAGLSGFAGGILGGTLAAEALYPRRWELVPR